MECWVATWVGRSVTGVTLLNKGDLGYLTYCLLHGLGQLPHLCTILFIGWRDQRVHRGMDLASCTLFGSAIASPAPAFLGRVQGPTSKKSS